MDDRSVHDITLWPVEPVAPKRVRRADATANEQLILETAQRLFAEQSIESVTMSAIAAAAGIGKGTLYRAFANKGELALALMDEDLRGFQERTVGLLSARAKAAPLDLLAAYLDSLVRFMEGHASLMCLAEEHGALRNQPEIDQTSLHEWFRLTILLLLRRAAKAGEIGEDADLDYLADAVLAPLNPRLLRHQLQVQDLSVDTVSQQLVRFVMVGVGGQYSSE